MRLNCHAEPDWNRISGLFPRTRSKRVYIHGPLANTLVEVRPDFTIMIKDALGRKGDLRRGHGFLIGSRGQPQFFDYRNVEQALFSPKEPILFSSLSQSDFAHRLTSLTLTDSDGNMRVHQYLSITNLHPTQTRTGQWYFQNIEASHDQFYVHANEDYVPFNSVAAPWLNGMSLEQQIIDSTSGSLLNPEGLTLMRYKADSSSHVEYRAQAGEFKHILRFEMTLAPGETKQIQVEIYDTFVQKLPGSRSDEIEAFMDEETGIAESRKIWNESLSNQSQVYVPEAAIQKIFDTAQTNSLQLIAQREDGAALPGQGGFNDYTVVYTWEVSIYLRMLTRLGETDIVKKTLAYFLSTQENSIGPEGDILSPEGSFRAYIFWMGETGSVLGLLADYYLVTKDREWLRANLSIILHACEWVCKERNATKVYKNDGTKAAHFGLLPEGRVHDWPDKGYFYFSNVTTWQGLSSMAAALADIEHPDAPGYLTEANEYKICILESIKQGTYVDHENVRWMPNEVYTKMDVRTGVYAIDGPISFMDTGLIQPSDEIIPEIEYMMRKHYAMSDMFAVKLPGMEDPTLGVLQEEYAGTPIDLYYVNSAERVWHRTWSLRGEREKALRYFYSTMAFSTTLDTFHVHERYSPQLPWLSPWQPNGSGNGRIMEMILNTLFIVENDKLYLLPCVPAEWLDVGKHVQVNHVGTVFGKLSFFIERSSLHTIEVNLSLPSGIDQVSLNLFMRNNYRIHEIEELSIDGKASDWHGSVSVNTLALKDPGREMKFKVVLSASH
ncbi:hypothetical protein [Paenibacillus eucommiae]|uniref:Glycosyl hydrolase 36 catalytic domain-containing protein n=1 Tax=Paenibacillus eucommiae TaxID=1355755 RepID=A0ABS4J1J3_9BACL|nr:hypothetical protein [Paenibacillus eucommiae]MBP1993713.1 hypothetical protein [Paenibacillus eucommiae]